MADEPSKLILLLFQSETVGARCAQFINDFARVRFPGIRVEVVSFVCDKEALLFMGLSCTDECSRHAMNTPKIHAILTFDFYSDFKDAVKAKDHMKMYENTLYSSLNVGESLYAFGYHHIDPEDTPGLAGVRGSLFSKIIKIIDPEC